MKRWLLRILGALVAVLVIGIVTIYVVSERIIKARHPFREYAITLPTDSASLAEGARLARMRCAGCHGDSLQGRPDFFDDPMVARIVAPSIPARLATLTDAEFAGFLRSGVRKDGTSPFVMPPPGFYHMSDVEVGALIAYLRTLPNTNPSYPANSYGPMGRFGVALGQFKTAVGYIDTTQARLGADPAWATTRHGEYLARVICTECHGPRLTGDPQAPGGNPSPSLAGAYGYSLDEFVHLIRTGTPRDPNTKLSTMAEMALLSLTHLTDAEITALYDYLKGLPTDGMK